MHFYFKVTQNKTGPAALNFESIANEVLVYYLE